MSSRALVVSPQARRDFSIAIAWYEQNLGARAAAKAARTISKVLTAIEETPDIGSWRPDLPEGCLRIAARQHLIIYRLLTSEIRILRIVHGARNIATIVVGG